MFMFYFNLRELVSFVILCRPVARIYAGGRGGGGGAYERLRREMSSAAGASPKGGLGQFSPRKLKKNGF